MSAPDPGVFPASWLWRAGPTEPGPTVVFDVDGVLSDASGRQHYLEGSVQYWDAFFAACDQDAILESQVSLGQLLAPELTVVVPTFKERDNVAELVRRLHLALAGVRWEVVFVDDDSPDGTAEAVRALARSDPQVRCIQRIGRRGLSSACVEGALASAAP